MTPVLIAVGVCLDVPRLSPKRGDSCRRIAGRMVAVRPGVGHDDILFKGGVVFGPWGLLIRPFPGRCPATNSLQFGNSGARSVLAASISAMWSVGRSLSLIHI